MPLHTIDLSEDHEIALAYLTGCWNKTQTETEWDIDLVFERIVLSTLETTLRELDSNLGRLREVGLKLSAGMQRELVKDLSEHEKNRLESVFKAVKSRESSIVKEEA